MIKFMKMLNNISRSQAIYRHSKIAAKDLNGNHYAFALAICRAPGRSQEELARELCVNKSTVARNLNHLEECGYIIREALKNDKRQFSVFPTSKLLEILPEIKAASQEWTALLSEGIDEGELDVFHSVLSRMQEKARKIIDESGAEK